MVSGVSGVGVGAGEVTDKLWKGGEKGVDEAVGDVTSAGVAGEEDVSDGDAGEFGAVEWKELLFGGEFG